MQRIMVMKFIFFIGMAITTKIVVLSNLLI